MIELEDFPHWVKILNWLEDAKPGDIAIYGNIKAIFGVDGIKFSRL